MSKILAVNVSHQELSKGVMVSKGLKVNMLHLELLDGALVSNSLRVNLYDKVGYHGLPF